MIAAYGWADLDAEERAGQVRYLRPSFQASGEETQSGLALVTPEAPEAEPTRRAWPGSLAKQLAAVRQAVEAGADSPEAVRSRFTDAPARGVTDAPDALAELGLVRARGEGVAA